MRLKNKFRPNLSSDAAARGGRIRRPSGGDGANAITAATPATPTTPASAVAEPRSVESDTFPMSPRPSPLQPPPPASPSAKHPPAIVRRVSSPPPTAMAMPPSPAARRDPAPPQSPSVVMSPFSPAAGSSVATAASIRSRHLSTASVGSEMSGFGRQRRLTESRDPHQLPQVPASVFVKRKADHKRKFNNGVPERDKMTMFDLIYYNPSDGSRMSNSSSRRTSRASISSEDPLRSPDSTGGRGVLSSRDDHDATLERVRERLEEEGVDNDLENGSPKKGENENQGQEEEDEGEDDAMPVPQVKVGPDGEMILDEESTVIETTASKRAKEELLQAPLVFESSRGSSNYGTWGRRRRKNVDWTERETVRFYRALSVFGTDFSMMESVFKRRSRHELKMKFKKEERGANRALVDKCLAEGGRGQFDAGAAFHSDTDDDDVESNAAAAAAAAAQRKKRRRPSADAARPRKAAKRRRSSNRGYYDSSSDADIESDQSKGSPRRRPPSTAVATVGASNVEGERKKTTTIVVQKKCIKPGAGDTGSASPLLKSLLSDQQQSPKQSSSVFPPGLLAANPGLANAAPGSLLVVASPAQGDPQKHMLHVYRIGGNNASPQQQGGTASPQQPETANKS